MYEKNRMYPFHLRISAEISEHIEKRANKMNISKSKYVYNLLYSDMINGGRYANKQTSEHDFLQYGKMAQGKNK